MAGQGVYDSKVGLMLRGRELTQNGLRVLSVGFLVLLIIIFVFVNFFFKVLLVLF